MRSNGDLTTSSAATEMREAERRLGRWELHLWIGFAHQGGRTRVGVSMVSRSSKPLAHESVRENRG
jgi:hypothetical protein